MLGSLVLSISSDQKWKMKIDNFKFNRELLSAPLWCTEVELLNSELRQDEPKTDVNENKLPATLVAIFLVGPSHSDVEMVLMQIVGAHIP